MDTECLTRGIAFHKMIHFITMALGGERFLNFMANKVVPLTLDLGYVDLKQIEVVQTRIYIDKSLGEKKSNQNLPRNHILFFFLYVLLAKKICNGSFYDVCKR